MNRKDALLIAMTAGIIAAPLILAAMVVDGLNDKPSGYHVTPATYVRTCFLCLVAGTLIWLAARRWAEPQNVAWRCWGIAWLIAAALTLSVCVVPEVLGLWGQLVLDDLTPTGMN